MKLAVVIGHNSRSQGAVRSDTNESEWEYNNHLYEYMVYVAANYRDLEIQKFLREPYGGYSKEIENVYNATDNWGADATVELHFNAAGDPSATGTETLSSGSSKSVLLAQEVQMELVETLGLRDRGIKIRNSRTKGRGYLSLVSGNAPAIIAEPFFATSKAGRLSSDSENERRKIAEAIVEGAYKAMKQF